MTNARPFYVKFACVLFCVIVLGYLAILGKELLSPLFFAGLFSILLLPLAGWLERKCHLSRRMASVLSVLLLLSGITAIFYVVGDQINSLVGEWPAFKDQLNSSLGDLQKWISTTLHINLDTQMSYLNTASGRLLNSGTGMIGSTLLTVSGMIFFILFTFLYSIFFLLYRRLIMRFFIAAFRNNNKFLVQEIIEEGQTIIRKYILGLFIEMAVVSFVLCIAFSILGIRYAILLGLLGGLFNLIPYIGIFTALLVSVLITFAAAAAGKVLLVVIVLVSTHLVDSNVLFPWIVGSKVRINAMAMIGGVVVGGLIWGIAGMFLSIPVMAVLKIIFDKIESLKYLGILVGADEKNPLPAAIKPSENLNEVGNQK